MDIKDVFLFVRNDLGNIDWEDLGFNEEPSGPVKDIFFNLCAKGECSEISLPDKAVSFGFAYFQEHKLEFYKSYCINKPLLLSKYLKELFELMNDRKISKKLKFEIMNILEKIYHLYVTKGNNFLSEFKSFEDFLDNYKYDK